MPDTARRSLVLAPPPAAALDDARGRTLRVVDRLTPALLDWQPPGGGNGAGSLLYHIALIEADWLSAEVREEPEGPPDLLALFPWPVRDESGRLTVVTGLDLAAHLARLDAVRALTVATFATMSLDDFRRVRALPAYDVTPGWVAHHLLQHEAEQRGEMGINLGLARVAPGQ